MKKNGKRMLAAVLMLTMLIAGMPTTAYAKEPYRWQKSLTLTGKQYKDCLGYDGVYAYLIFVDHDTTLTVQNGTGTVRMYAYGGASMHGTPAHGYSAKNFCYDTLYFSIQKQKKNEKSSIKVESGRYTLYVAPCSNTSYKANGNYNCKVSVKDGNLVLLSSVRQTDADLYSAVDCVNTTKFFSWVDPQIASLSAWKTHKNRICNNLAEAMIKGGFSSKKKATLAKEIDKAVENAVQKSKEKNIKIINHEEAVLQYIDSVDGLKAWMQETYKGSAKEMTYWDSLKDMTAGLLYAMKDYYMVNK